MKIMKSVQLDLASQKETLERIFEFFELAAKYKYNCVTLYLEDRIKTESYPYLEDEESYTPDEIKEMVKYAEKLGLDLLPEVSNFSHTGRFLKHKELRHLAELRGNIKGRFNEAGSAPYITACPLLPEAQKFFDTYMSEVSALFPFEYFLVGLDEDFDIGHCELCRADVEEHGGITHLFLNHIKRTNALIKSFGKTMIMDDDMFWFCPDIIPEIPKDVILRTWNYDYIDRFPRCQFGNQRQRNIFKLYDKYGLKYIACTWTIFANNVDTYTKYAENYSPIGYLNTEWQMTAEQIHYTYPLVAYTGMLWNGELADDPIARMKKAVSETCETNDPYDISVLAEAASKVYLIRTPMYHLGNTMVRRNVYFDDEYRDIVYGMEALEHVKANNPVARQTKLRAKRAKLLYDVYILSQDVMDFRSGMNKIDKSKTLEKLYTLKQEMQEHYSIQNELWDEFRQGIPRTRLENEEKYDISKIDELIAFLKDASFGEKGVLDMVMLLPDKSTASKIQLTVKYADGEEKLPVGIYKPLATACYYIADKGPYLYTVSFIIDGKREICGCDVNVKGFGATTISYISAFQNGKEYVPAKVKAVCGRVENPEHLLDNDTKFASIGNPDMIKAMNDSRLADEVATVAIEFREE